MGSASTTAVAFQDDDAVTWAVRVHCDGYARPPMNTPSAELPSSPALPPKNLDVPLERDVFTRTLIRELSGVLQDGVGLEEASGFVSIVGQNMGREIETMYKKAYEVKNLSREQVKDVLLDLKRRIQGDFFVLEEDDDKIVFGNRACPFAEKVIGRPAMCMMTSNVFGAIAANNLGYAKVELQKTIAQGDPGCRVVLYLKPTDAAAAAAGREYFKSEEPGNDA